MASPSTTTHMIQAYAMGNWWPMDKNLTTAAGRSTNTKNITTINNFSDILSVDARLAAISAGVYTQARLNTMTLNDKLYAIAQTDQPGLVR